MGSLITEGKHLYLASAEVQKSYAVFRVSLQRSTGPFLCRLEKKGRSRGLYLQRSTGGTEECVGPCVFTLGIQQRFREGHLGPRSERTPLQCEVKVFLGRL